MEKKYEFVKDDFVMVNGNKLYRIKSLVDIEQIRGSVGGTFNTTDGFKGMNPEDTLEVIMQSESFVF